jgi:alpha-tubulin suppressor-like RCC1 family protein
MWVWGRNDVNQLGLNTTAWYSVPTKIDNSTNWKQVSIGGSYAATKTDGTLWVWGSNVWGQLGLGDTSTRSMVTQLGTLSDWNQVESGNYYKLATKTDGTLWSWGYNYYGQLGLTSVTAYVYSPVQVGTHSNWSKISVYDSSSAAIKTDGTMWVWGNNSWGQLGLNTYALSNIYTPVQVGLLNNWSDVKVGNDHMLAIKTDGTLWTWGYNNFGQLGISNGTNQIVSPTQVGNLSNWSKINSYYSSSAAINSNGELYVWGYNASYQLGQFDTTNRSIPVQFERGTYQWKKIAAGYTHSLAIQTNGTLWGLGGNQYGQLGTSNTATYSFYVQAGDSLWSEIAAGTYFSLGIQSNGTLWAWGYNNYGQIGNATTNTIYSPIQIGANLWKKVACGYANSLAIQSNGTLWSWGLNNTGQGAQSNTTTRYSPVQVGTLTDWSEVRTNVNGSTHTLALKTNGTIWTWGYNNYGELGLNTTGTYYSPVQVGTMSNWTKIGIGMNNNFAISEYGNTLWGSGKGQFTNLLSGISISLSTLYYYPSKISSEFAKSITSSECVPYALNKFTGTIIQPSDEDVPNIDTSVVWNNIDAGKYHFVGIKNDGTAWGIGHNFYGQLGTGDITYRRSLTQIGARTDWNKVYCGDYNTMLVDNSMNGWVFGGNDVYQLGLSDSTNRSSPVQITYTQVKTASISDDGSWMVDNTNNIWASGAVNTNYFGVNTINAKSSPSQVTNNSNWAFAQQTVLNGMALNSNGTLFAWGSSGAVMGVTYSAGGIFPVQVNNDTWKAFGLTQPNGSTTAVAIKTDGTLWGWGSQAVILNTTTTYSSPIQLSATSGWSKLNCGYRCALAIKTDGTLWAWGINTMGALGTGDITNRSTPTQIGLLTNWSQVVAGSRSSFAIKTNGTLWAWGNNPQGQLGLSDLTNRSSPVQVGTLSNWAQVDNQEDDTVALKTDGTLWSWGYNSLGLNTTTRFSSPVQVGSASNWTKVSLGSRRLMVINSLNELWVTGYNSNGVLGLGDITDRPVLTQVPGSWTFTSSNHGTPSYDSFFGIKTDGTMWSCGYNRGYLLGDYRSFTYPDKKSADGVYVSVATSKQNTLLTKTDGTIWAVGNNSFGVLGQINATPKFSPVQIGTINTTTKIDSKNYSAAFIFK